jgi:hypothetical protein
VPAYGISAKKEYPSKVRYKIQWKKDCATTCLQIGFGDASTIPCADFTQGN